MNQDPSVSSPPSAGIAQPPSFEMTGWPAPEARMHAALERNELELLTQSIAMLSTGERNFMAEVLVRMREEEDRLLHPGEFLPVFEHFRMMPALDRWVVRRALAHLARRGIDGYSCLSVNISGQTLDDGEFLPFVAEELVRRDVDPNALCFEIYERDMLRKIGAAARFSEIARRIGCGILIDGFGARSVSYGPLLSLQPDFAKIDGIIVRKILDNPKALEKLAAIRHFCRIHHIAPIAECVENERVLAKLIEAGIGLAQGFGVAVPQPLERAVPTSPH
ncbi:MAG: EAL domain-containing protein [Betaproteobacteria bacterium]|nr:EAL domain-containing protein [Betaproteobacteria bacterium]